MREEAETPVRPPPSAGLRAEVCSERSFSDFNQVSLKKQMNDVKQMNDEDLRVVSELPNVYDVDVTVADLHCRPSSDEMDFYLSMSIRSRSSQ